MTVTLALDTATPYLTLGLRWEGGELETVQRIERAHAERLPQAVTELFRQADLPLRAGRIVIGTGPGSYTGVRVGASYALALARAWNAELLGVPTLAALVDLSGPIRQAPALDARKGQVYGAVYLLDGGGVPRPLTAPAKASAEDWQQQAQSAAAVVRPDPVPSGRSLLAAAPYGEPQPHLRLSYL